MRHDLTQQDPDAPDPAAPVRTTDTIRFLLNGEEVTVRGISPNTTVLRWLRDHRRLTGTKEGCAEGDCGACTVMVAVPQGGGDGDGDGVRRRTENACIRLIGQLHGTSVTTIEHLGADYSGEGHPDGLHPVQRELIDRHGSQCGYCTPGFAMQIAGAHERGRLRTRDEAVDAISGNLCRCTGYGPIVDAALATGRAPLPTRDDAALRARLDVIAGEGSLAYGHDGETHHQPRTADELSALVLANPDATLLAGGTDVGLWVAKLHRPQAAIIEVNRVEGLDRVEPIAIRGSSDGVRVHAAAPHAAFHEAVRDWHPDLDTLMRRFAGSQTRAVGTVCGNVANGSPIGDLNPTMIALDATLIVRRGDERRRVAAEGFFVAYGRQDRRPGEWLEAIDVPRPATSDLVHVSKVSKRTESDISAVLGAFRLVMADGVVAEARLAFGGMAATPSRASNAEAALTGRAFDAASVADAARALGEDFDPISDMRASAAYRMSAARGLLTRFLVETEGGAPTLRGLDVMEAAE